MIPTKKVLNVPVTCLPFEEQIMLILRWAKMRASKVVCLANVHMIMEAYWNSSFENVLSKADLVTPDGKPLVFMLRKLGVFHQNQVAGMDVFLNLCDLAEKTGTKVYFVGSTQDILNKMKQRLDREYPILKIAGMKSIPKISIEEIPENIDKELIAEINQSGAGIVFVCLGCPKQEVWMSHYQGLINSVMVGVGAVFSMYAGINPRAPYWVQQAGLEWLYRLAQEPRRLWRRYGSTIPPFLYLAGKQLLAPYKNNSSPKWKPLERNIVVDVNTIDRAPEKLGEILVRQNVLTRKELEKALEQQKFDPSSKLGEILVRNSLISVSELKFYLRNQNIKFGEFLVEKRILNQRSLNNLLTIADRSNKKLGEVLLEQSILSSDRLKELAIEHYTRRKGLFLTKNITNDDLSVWAKDLLAS